jgi:hypothetical protein
MNRIEIHIYIYIYISHASMFHIVSPWRRSRRWGQMMMMMMMIVQYCILFVCDSPSKHG